MSTPAPEQVRQYLRQRYGALAGQAGADPGSSCCGGPPAREPGGCCSGDEAVPASGPSGCCSGAPSDYAAQLGYTPEEQAAAPAGADLGLGCGNPVAIAGIRPGETVLDLGSGAGFDAFLAARQLAGTGRVIGVDMTPPMVDKARQNAARAGWPNVEFRLGEIEALPVPDACVDLIISNCVLNLSTDKPRVLAEAFRVLKPGGRLAITDVVATQPLPPALREKLPLIGACIAGATLVGEFREMLAAAGFERIAVQPREESRRFIAQWGDDPAIGDHLVSAVITAVKPRAGA